MLAATQSRDGAASSVEAPLLRMAKADDTGIVSRVVITTGNDGYVLMAHAAVPIRQRRSSMGAARRMLQPADVEPRQTGARADRGAHRRRGRPGSRDHPDHRPRCAGPRPIAHSVLPPSRSVNRASETSSRADTAKSPGLSRRREMGAHVVVCQKRVVRPSAGTIGGIGAGGGCASCFTFVTPQGRSRRHSKSAEARRAGPPLGRRPRAWEALSITVSAPPMRSTKSGGGSGSPSHLSCLVHFGIFFGVQPPPSLPTLPLPTPTAGHEGNASPARGHARNGGPSVHHRRRGTGHLVQLTRHPVAHVLGCGLGCPPSQPPPL
jgi:hypothetical protein